MSDHFCLTVRFLQPMHHGRGDGGEPEWPPSPLRVFQALVAASAARSKERIRLEEAVPALSWLEQLCPPLVVAAVAERSTVKYRLYVPDNVGDKVAKSWSRGGTGSIADYRTEKDVCPVRLLGEEGAVHYLWTVSIPDPDLEKHKEVLFAAARSITHLGWGIDMVAAKASVIPDVEAEKLPGERWYPTDAPSAVGYRVPVQGTLDALMDRHNAFLNRLGPDGFHPVPPLSAFRVVGYEPAAAPTQSPFAAFSLRTTDGSKFRPFDTARMGMVVSAMMRHAAKEAAEKSLGWSEQLVAELVCGHSEPRGHAHEPVDGPRLAYLPLPSIESRGPGRNEVVGSIRRGMVVLLGGRGSAELQQLTRVISGADLIQEGTGHQVALLAQIPASDRMVRRYTDPAETWATVTPVILPGHDDRRGYRRRLFGKADGAPLDSGEQRELLSKLDRRIDHLLRKAIRQVGYSNELAEHAEIEWRNVGFWPGTELATHYQFPNKLRRFRRLHVRITWRDSAGNAIKMPGPICLGGGRFVGLGLFAPYSSD